MGSDTKHPGMRGDAEVIVGYALTEKKCKSLFSPELIAHARSQGVHFLPIDPAHPIESQAGHPFDVVLQKVPAASPHKSTWDERIQRYAEDFPEAYVVDLPSAVRQVANRDTMLNAVVRVGSENVVAVRAPRQIVAAAGTEEEVMAQVDAAGLQLPLLAKSLLADGSSDSHKVAIIHDLEGLACVVRGDVPGLRPPCIMQEYVNHGGCLFKVYVVGDAVTMTRRKSLPDLRGARRSIRRRAKAARVAKALTAAAAAAPAAALNGGGGVRVGGEDMHVRGTADVDGDVDDSGSDESHEASDGEGGGWYATGLQSVPRVSCFKGGATDNETSWRDRVLKEEKHTGLNDVMERMQMYDHRRSDGGDRRRGEPPAASGASNTVRAETASIATAAAAAGAAPGVVPAICVSDADGSGPGPDAGTDQLRVGRVESDLHYLRHHRLSSHLARNLTVSRVGSVDSIGGFSDSNDPSASERGGGSGGGSGSGDGGGVAGENGERRERRERRLGGRTGLPPLPPGSALRPADSPDDCDGSPGGARSQGSDESAAGSGSEGSGAGAEGAASECHLVGGAGGNAISGRGDGSCKCAGDGAKGVLGIDGGKLNGVLGIEHASPRRNPEMSSGNKPLELSLPELADNLNPPSDAFVRQLGLALRDKLRLRLFNFDLISVNGNGEEFLVVDINYFPGIAKMPGYSDTFCTFLRNAKTKDGSQL